MKETIFLSRFFLLTPGYKPAKLVVSSSFSPLSLNNLNPGVSVDFNQGLAIFLFFTSVALLSSAFFTLERSRKRGGLYPFLMLGTLGTWALVSGLNQAAGALETKVLLEKIWYFTGAFTPTVFLFFTLKFTYSPKWMQGPGIGILWLVPLIMAFLALTNEDHRLLWHSETLSAWHNLSYQRTPLNLINLLFGYLELFAGLFCLLTYGLKSQGLVRLQSLVLLASGSLPILVHVTLLIVDPKKTLPDVTPLTFAVSGLITAWTLLNMRLFQWAPVAREALLETSHDGMVFLDPSGAFLDANPTALKLLGLQEIPYGQKALGLPIQNTLLKNALASPTTEPYTWKDAQGQYWEGKVVETRSLGKNKLGLIHYWRDVTLLHNYIEHIERDRLKISTLLEERSTLLQVISHDINNSLGVISVWTDPLNHITETDCADFQREVHQASHASIQLIALVRDLISLEERHWTNQSFRLIESIQEAKTMVEHRGHGKNLHWNLIGDPEILVCAEPVSLTHSVIANLMTNAQKFSPPGGTIEVRWETQGQKVLLRVQDQGQGVPLTQRPHLFNFVTNRSTPGTRGETGSGFGLPLAKKFLSLYGGTIEYEEGPQGGGGFLVTLPKGDSK